MPFQHPACLPPAVRKLLHKARNPLRKQQHQQQDDAAQHGTPVIGVARYSVMQPGERKSTHHRTGQSLYAAQQHHHQTIDRAAHAQRVRRDAAFGKCVQPSGQASGRACNDKSDPLQALDIHANRICPHGRVTPGPQAEAKRREQHAAQQQHTGHHQRQREVVIAALVCQPVRRPDTRKPIAAARELIPLVGNGPGDLRKGQRQHRQIHPRQPHRKPAIQQRAQRSNHRRSNQRQFHRHAGAAHKQRSAVRTQTKIRCVAKRMHAGRPHDEVQTGRKQRRHQQVNHQHGGVGRLRREDGQSQQQNAQRSHCDKIRLAGRAQWLFLHTHIAAGSLRAPEQTPGTCHQHHGHHQKFHHQSQLGKRHAEPAEIHDPQPDAQRLDFGNQQCRHIRARDRAHAADHHHHKRSADGVEVHLQRGGFARQLQGTAQARQQRAQCKNSREKPGLIHAERAHHLTVLRGGAHQRAPARAREQQPQQTQHDRTHHDQKQVIGRELPSQNLDGTFESGRARPQQFVWPPQPQHRILDHQHQCKSGQQLEQLWGLVDTPQQQHLNQRTQHTHGHRRQQQCGPESQA